MSSFRLGQADHVSPGWFFIDIQCIARCLCPGFAVDDSPQNRLGVAPRFNSLGVSDVVATRVPGSRGWR